MEKVYTAIIGGGQAGLAMSRHLCCLGREHVVFASSMTLVLAVRPWEPRNLRALRRKKPAAGAAQGHNSRS